MSTKQKKETATILFIIIQIIIFLMLSVTFKSVAYCRSLSYNWYHFLSRYFDMSWWAVPLNCCASFAIFSALSSNLFNLSPRSIISWCARLTSLEADVARVPSSWILALGPEISFATERFGLPLAHSPTVRKINIRYALEQQAIHA